MKRPRWQWRLAAFAGAGLAAYAAAGLAVCEAPRAMLADGVIVADKQMQVAWTAVQGATAYRVRVQSRVPNGRVVASHDTTVAKPLFRAPQPLAEQRAKVTVRLSAVCGAETSAETVSWFVIDTSASCRLGEVAAKWAEGKARLDWKAVPGAQTYEVRAHAVADGRMLAARETRVPSAELALKQTAVVSVRPLCPGGEGEAVYRMIAAD